MKPNPTTRGVGTQVMSALSSVCTEAIQSRRIVSVLAITADGEA